MASNRLVQYDRRRNQVSNSQIMKKILSQGNIDEMAQDKPMLMDKWQDNSYDSRGNTFV